MFRRLKEVDPKTASKLHPHDLVRTIRALEVFESTGVPISFYREQHRFEEKPYLTLKLGLEMSREKIYRRIEERVDRMIEQGFLQEVEGLLALGYGPELKPMQSLGYIQMVRHLMKEIGWDEAIRQIKGETRHYAKRQWTWFRADSEVGWLDESADRQRMLREITAFLRGERVDPVMLAGREETGG